MVKPVGRYSCAVGRPYYWHVFCRIRRNSTSSRGLRSVWHGPRRNHPDQPTRGFVIFLANNRRESRSLFLPPLWGAGKSPEPHMVQGVGVNKMETVWSPLPLIPFPPRDRVVICKNRRSGKGERQSGGKDSERLPLAVSIQRANQMKTFNFTQAAISHNLKDPRSKSLEPNCLSPSSPL